MAGLNGFKAGTASTTCVVLLAIIRGAGAQEVQAPLSATNLPAGPGRETISRSCSQCHTIETLTLRKETPVGWAAVADNMVARGAQLSPEQVREAVAYLARNFPGVRTGLDRVVPEEGSDHDRTIDVRAVRYEILRRVAEVVRH